MFRPPTDPGRPFVTYYDDAADERTELSYASFGNWIAKTANLIQDELDASGQLIAIHLPLHWQTLVWLTACWEAGAVAAPGLHPATADHAVVGPDALDLASGCRGERIALSLRSFGGRFTTALPAGFQDYGVVAPAQPDRFVRYGGPPAQADTALVIDGVTYNHGELGAAGHEAAVALGLDAQSRLITNCNPSSWPGLRDGLLAPLAAGASVVLCRNLDRARLSQRTRAERITHSVL